MKATDKDGPRRPSLQPRGEDLWRGVLLAPQAREALSKGVETMAHAVAVTLGPLGRTVAINPIVGRGAPELVGQGSLVARRLIEIPNRYNNAGAMLIRHLAWNVRRAVGDGSATATVLARAMVWAGTRVVAAGANPMIVRQGMEKAIAQASRELATLAQPLESRREITAVARAAAGEADLAAAVAEAFDIAGLEGVVRVEDYFGTGLSCEVTDGVRWDSGLAAPEFATDEGYRLVVSEPAIALASMKLYAAEQVLPSLKEALGHGAGGLVVIAPEIEGQALATLLANHNQGRLAVAPLKAPGLFDSRPAILEDLAALTGAALMDDKAGSRAESLRARDLGWARRVVATARDFRIIGPRGRPAEVRQRIAQVKAEVDALDRQEKATTWDRLMIRLANLSGGAVVLRVGAVSKEEARLKAAMTTDAVQTVRCAVKEGIVPGGGAAYVACVPSVLALLEVTPDPDEAAGVRVVAEALTAPLYQIAENAGYSGSTIVARLHRQGGGYAFEALSGRIVPVAEAEIFDPVKVMRVALEMAAGIAATVLTTDAIVLTGRMGRLEKKGRRGVLRGTDTTP